MLAKPWVVLAAMAALLLVGCAADPLPAPASADKPATAAPIVPIKCVGHTDFVGTVAISPDGKLVVSGGNDATLRFWNAADGQAIRTVQARDAANDADYIHEVMFLPDGKSIAARVFQRPKVMLRFWDAATARELKERAVEMDTGYGLAFSPDGTKLAVAGPHEVRVLDAVNYRQLTCFKPAGGKKSAFSNDGSILAAVFPARSQRLAPSPAVRAWDLDSGLEVFANWDGHMAYVVAISANNKLIAGGAEGDCGLVKIWDLATRKLLHTLSADKDGVFCLACSPNGKTLASSGNEPTVKLWDLTTGTMLAKLGGHQGKPCALAFSANANTLVSGGSDKLVMIWRIAARSLS